jgi:hypothetical protein
VSDPSLGSIAAHPCEKSKDGAPSVEMVHAKIVKGGPAELTIEEVAGILSKGAFDEFISAVEHEQFECKSGLYDIRAVKGKIELAKDVSALANSAGGYLLIGPATEKDQLHNEDEVKSVSQFPSSLFQPDTYRNILNAFIYPPIPNLEIQWYAGKDEPTKGIASIFVPPKSVDEKPFLVVQSDVDSQVSGSLFGYFERVGDDALPTSVHMIRDMMKDGKRYGDLERKLGNLEGLITKLGSNQHVSVPPVKKENLVKPELLLLRASEARRITQLLDVPSFFLIGAPLEPVKLNGLFSSKSVEYQAISDPPAYRAHGFDLNPHTPVQHVRGELIRRVTNGRKGLELWQDGTLILVGRNDEDFLGWAVRRKQGERNAYINNYVLTEVVSLFCTLVIKVFGSIQAAPEKARVGFGLTTGDVQSFELSTHHIDPTIGSFSGKKIPAEDKTFWIEFDLKDAIAEVEALRLLQEIYHWFEFMDEQIPYVDFQSKPPRVDRSRYAPG